MFRISKLFKSANSNKTPSYEQFVAEKHKYAKYYIPSQQEKNSKK